MTEKTYVKKNNVHTLDTRYGFTKKKKDLNTVKR